MLLGDLGDFSDLTGLGDLLIDPDDPFFGGGGGSGTSDDASMALLNSSSSASSSFAPPIPSISSTPSASIPSIPAMPSPSITSPSTSSSACPFSSSTPSTELTTEIAPAELAPPCSRSKLRALTVPLYPPCPTLCSSGPRAHVENAAYKPMPSCLSSPYSPLPLHRHRHSATVIRCFAPGPTEAKAMARLRLCSSHTICGTALIGDAFLTGLLVSSGSPVEPAPSSSVFSASGFGSAGSASTSALPASLRAGVRVPVAMRAWALAKSLASFTEAAASLCVASG
mmetsp:Transcript_58919/g.162883  ORF Transcript_58919/g.162883 Transcript_58919/m.162883 type:complete len:283 (-) Transcript_58919:207-1055(-)